VLVIDDEPYVREALQRVLARAGYTVTTAADAEAGIARQRQTPADVLIVDLVLSGMDGISAIAQLRSEFPGVGIIAMTGGGQFGLDEYRPQALATQAFLEAARKAGANGVLAKPFEVQQLRNLVAQVARMTTALAV
jgi:CheY-like chemotaxis protein